MPKAVNTSLQPLPAVTPAGSRSILIVGGNIAQVSIFTKGENRQIIGQPFELSLCRHIGDQFAADDRIAKRQRCDVFITGIRKRVEVLFGCHPVVAYKYTAGYFEVLL